MWNLFRTAGRGSCGLVGEFEASGNTFAGVNAGVAASDSEREIAISSLVLKGARPNGFRFDKLRPWREGAWGMLRLFSATERTRPHQICEGNRRVAVKT